jgi:hypothetical protein
MELVADMPDLGYMVSNARFIGELTQHSTVVRYKGGSLYMADGTFGDCAFDDFGSDLVNRKVLADLQRNSSKPSNVAKSLSSDD